MGCMMGNAVHKRKSSSSKNKPSLDSKFSSRDLVGPPWLVPTAAVGLRRRRRFRQLGWLSLSHWLLLMCYALSGCCMGGGRRKWATIRMFRDWMCVLFGFGFKILKYPPGREFFFKPFVQVFLLVNQFEHLFRQVMLRMTLFVPFNIAVICFRSPTSWPVDSLKYNLIITLTSSWMAFVSVDSRITCILRTLISVSDILIVRCA